MIGAEATTGRRRASVVLFSAVALGTTGFVATMTIAPLVGADLSHSASLSGVPWSSAVLGTGLGSAALSRIMSRRGRVAGLTAGYAIGIVGAAAAAFAVIAGMFWVFVLGVLLAGGANAANGLARYAAADVYPPQRRGAALSTIVWAGTVGGVAGPALLAPTGALAMNRDLPNLAGPTLLAVCGFVAALAVLASLRRSAIADARPDDEPRALSTQTVVAMWRSPSAQVALVALAVSQAVMVLIMAMTPLHIRMAGHGLGSVGLVMAAHVFGMYGFSPLTGRLADRTGAVPVVLLGFTVITIAALAAAGSPEHAGTWLALPLFLLGLGWSCSFVAGSSLLAHGLSYSDRARLQGATDAVVWIAAAVAGLGSGLLVDSLGYAMLCIVGAAIIALPFVLVLGQRRALAPA